MSLDIVDPRPPNAVPTTAARQVGERPLYLTKTLRQSDLPQLGQRRIMDTPLTASGVDNASMLAKYDQFYQQYYKG